MNLGWLLFGFNGRINRAKYWLATLIYTAVNLSLVLIGRVWGDTAGYQIVSLFLSVAILVSVLAVGSKRLHDRNRSAWWLLLFYLLPVAILAWIGFDIATGSNVTLRYVALYLALLVIWIWVIVELGCLRGTVGSNAYGPDPLSAKD
jgi:uncharacterized membrane protein YhaH (DUF805 family)